MIYAFEEIGPELEQAPLAARRALGRAGVVLSAVAWRALLLEARQGIVAEGARAEVNMGAVKSLVSPVPKGLRFVASFADPPADAVPAALARLLVGIRPISAAEWARLRPLDRYSLAVLANNTRLLWRAISELGQTGMLGPAVMPAWVGQLARCEVRANPILLVELANGRIQDGRALVIARAAGRRAARAVSETLYGHPEQVAGAIEVDARVDAGTGTVLWQAHVSTSEGEFFAAASLLAAVTAAVALRDALSERDPGASIAEGSVHEEGWTVGSGVFRDDTTMVVVSSQVREAAMRIAPPPLEEPPARPLPVSTERPRAQRVTVQQGVPTWVVIMMMVTSLVLAAAVFALILKRG